MGIIGTGHHRITNPRQHTQAPLSESGVGIISRSYMILPLDCRITKAWVINTGNLRNTWNAPIEARWNINTDPINSPYNWTTIILLTIPPQSNEQVTSDNVIIELREGTAITSTIVLPEYEGRITEGLDQENSIVGH